MTTRDDGPPPRWALRCPRRRGHTNLFVRNHWFYCDSCAASTDRSPRLYFVVDLESDRLLAHPEFAERWGVHVYHDAQW